MFTFFLEMNKREATTNVLPSYLWLGYAIISDIYTKILASFPGTVCHCMSSLSNILDMPQKYLSLGYMKIKYSL